MSEERTATWYGHDNPDDLADWLLKANGTLLDAARDGRWTDVLAAIDNAEFKEFATTVNTWRFGGQSWFTPLHQAAWHGAPASVVTELLARGAWKSLRTADGRRAVDIAADRGHKHLLDLLEPTFTSDSYLTGSTERINSQLAALVERIAGQYFERQLPRLRPVDVTVLHEDAGPDQIWFPVGGMYGGFSLSVHAGYVHCHSWSRVNGGSGQYHVITERDAVLVDSGFV